MKKFLRIAVAALFIAALPHVAKAQTKASPTAVAHLDLDSLLDIMPEMKRASDSAATYYKMLEDQLYKMQVELNRKMNEYDSLSKNWSPLIKSLKEKEAQDLQQNIQANYRAKLVEPIFAKITAAVKDVAVAKGYRYVIDSSKTTGVVLYASPTDDIFNDVRIKLGIPVPAPGTGGATGGAPGAAGGR
jgi:outer membrane protein